ncbi:MAG: NAD(+)/NADH kinase [Gemmataceae bacterium]|nr:NAD(+)/NADH kinase [Gemmataceae bacterium]
MRIFVLGNALRPGVVEQAERLLPFIKKHCQVVLVDLEQKEDLSRHQADLTLVLGGDGAILRAARQMGYQQYPVLGINLGRLGFLADLGVQELESCLPQVAKGDFRITNHVMFECTGSHPAMGGPHLGLNEVVIHAGAPFHMIDMELQIDQETVCTYTADGLILSTPIGSTAHNLSAGGPIINQELEAFAITPICPHVLTGRSLVDSAGKTFQIKVTRAAFGTTLVIDGQDRFPIESGTVITIKKAPVQFRLAKVTGKSLYKSLREKLNWGLQPNYRQEPK